MNGRLKAWVMAVVWAKLSVKKRLNTQPGVKKRRTKRAAGIQR